MSDERCIKKLAENEAVNQILYNSYLENISDVNKN
jgi:hypothetical protein